MPARVTCLSPFDEATVHGLFKGRHEVDVQLVPEPPCQDAVLKAVHEAHLVIADKRHKHRIDRRVLENMRNCQLIQQAAVGFDTIDHRAAAEYGIPVANAAGYNKESVADLTILMILNLLRHAAFLDRDLRKGGWDRTHSGHQLGDLTVGIVGLGNVGATVARRLTGFGSRVIFTDALPREVPGTQPVDLDTLLQQSDVVRIHTPLDVDTERLIDAEAIAKMKPTAVLINAARGPIVDEAALVAALREGRLGGAGLDVFETEPLPADSPLRSLENVFLSPHVGGNTFEAESFLLEVVGANLNRILDGEEPVNIVNGVTRVTAR